MIFVVPDAADAEELTTTQAVFGVWMQLGWLLCLVIGVVAWVWGARRGHRGTARAGKIALAYVVFSLGADPGRCVWPRHWVAAALGVSVHSSSATGAVGRRGFRVSGEWADELRAAPWIDVSAD